MAEHELEKLLGGFAADTLTPEERRQLFTAAMQDQQLFDALADEQALKELLTDPAVRRRLLQSLNNTTQAPAGGSVSWLNWFRQPANLALAGGLATAVFAVVLGTKIYQDSVQQAARSAPTETTQAAAPTLPASQPAPSQSAEPTSKPKEAEATRPTIAKKDMPTDKLAPRKEAAPEPKILQAPAKSSTPVASVQPVSARALFYAEGGRAESGRARQDNERDMKAPAESEKPPNPFKRKLEGLSQLGKAAAPATPGKPLGLRYSFAIRISDGQEQEVDAATATSSSTPVHVTLETNRDGYIQVWRNVGSANTQLLLPLKESGHISMKIQAGQRHRLPLPADSGTVIVRFSPVPFGPISRQEAALLNRRSPNLLQESETSPSPTGSQEQATYVVSQDPSPTAQIAVDILLPPQQ